MVNKGSPDPPEALRDELSPPLCSNGDIMERVVDSDDDDMEINNYDGYAPLPLGPTDENELIPWNGSIESSDSSEDEDENDEPQEMQIQSANIDVSTPNLPPIETVDREVSRELWAGTRNDTSIEMNSERAHEVMTAMANFSLPPSSFPDWAHSITEEEWKQQLTNRINVIQQNR